jgi:hypothetical protein
MTYPAKVTAVCSAILAVSLGLSALLLTRIDRLRSRANLEDVLYIPSSAALRRMSLGYTGLAADIYWTRAVQYFGGKHQDRGSEYKLLAPLLDITTDLDPKLIVAYQFGSTFLAQKPPEGAGMPEQAVKLVEKGIQQNPGEWRLYYELGFLEALELKDYRAAASAFERGSQVKGAHPSLKIMAAIMAQHGGDRATARLLWTTTYQTATDQMIKDNAFRHLRALRVDEDVDHLEALVKRYREQTGDYPTTSRELVEVGWLPGIPVDPLGKPYKIRSEGRVEVQSPDDLPFITRGLPPGREASIVELPRSKR